MKYIKAVLYTVLMSILFLTGIVLTEGVVSAQQLDNYVKDLLEEKNYHGLLSGDYQSKTPIISKTASNEDLTLEIHGYETMNVIDDEENYYVEFFIEVTRGNIDSFAEVEFELSEGEYLIKFLKFLNKEFYLVMSEADETRLKTSELFSTPTTVLENLIITYEKEAEDVVFTIPLDIEATDLSFQAVITNYLNANDQTYPNEDTEFIVMLTPVELNTKTAVLITIIVEAILIIALTVYIYVFRPKRKLGKIKPSKHLAKDLERIEQSKENK